MREQKESNKRKKFKKNKKKKKFLSFVPSSLYFKNASGSTAPYKNHKRFAEEERDDDVLLDFPWSLLVEACNGESWYNIASKPEASSNVSEWLNRSGALS